MRINRLQRFCLAILIGAWLGAIGFLWFNKAATGTEFVANVFVTYMLIWGLLLVTSNRPAGYWATRFVAVGFALGFSIGLVELLVVARVVDFRVLFGVTTDEPWRNPVNRLDPELLHVRKPNLHLVGEQKGGDIAFYNQIRHPQNYPYDVRYDANGFRNSNSLADVDVAVIGDSFVEAFAVADDDLVTNQLAKLRKKPVANFGQIWYGPQQELVVLRRYVVPLKPRYCVWCFFEGNDLSDMRRYDAIIGDWPRKSARLDSAIERSFVRNAFLAGFERFGQLPERPDGESIKGTFKDNAGNRRELFFYYPGKKLVPADRPQFERLLDILSVAQNECRKAGVKLVVAVIPTKYRVYGSRCEFPPESTCQLWTQTDLPEKLETALAANVPEAAFVDLGKGFAERAGGPNLLYFVDDTHWTAAGHRLAAELISEKIKAIGP